MSSRLMNMKFMQRAAASDKSAPSTPAAEPAAKKQRLSNGGSVRSTPAQSPRSVAQSPADADEAKREEAFAREAAARGDSKWYLSLQQTQSPATPSSLRIVSAGYGALDAAGISNGRSAEDEEEDVPPVAGRRSFGKFNKAVEKQQQDEDASDSDDSDSEASEEEDDESDDPTGVNALIAAERRQAGEKARAERKAQKAADRAEAARMAEERRKKEVNLNNITSISSSGGGGARPGGARPDNRECFNCGGKGHLKSQCPNTDERKRKRLSR